MSDGDAPKLRPLGDGACLLCGNPTQPGATVCPACNVQGEKLRQ